MSILRSQMLHLAGLMLQIWTKTILVSSYIQNTQKLGQALMAVTSHVVMFPNIVHEKKIKKKSRKKMQEKCPPSHFLWWQIIKVPTYKCDNFLQKSSRSSCMCWVPAVYLCVFHLSVSVPLSFAFFIHNFGRETVIFVYVGDKEVTKDYLTAKCDDCGL